MFILCLSCNVLQNFVVNRSKTWTSRRVVSHSNVVSLITIRRHVVYRSVVRLAPNSTIIDKPSDTMAAASSTAWTTATLNPKLRRRSGVFNPGCRDVTHRVCWTLEGQFRPATRVFLPPSRRPRRNLSEIARPHIHHHSSANVNDDGNQDVPVWICFWLSAVITSSLCVTRQQLLRMRNSWNLLSLDAYTAVQRIGQLFCGTVLVAIRRLLVERR